MKSQTRLIQSFPPLARTDATVLILGSMPGQASLKAQQYYAHPRNAFWAIISDFIGIAPSTEYAQRCHSLLAHQIAVWDVLASCQRPGSLDANIVAGSLIVNDLPGFLAQHSSIHSILFNGRTAEKLFHQHVKAMLKRPYHYQHLPSTSPAHARQSLAQKQTHWLQALRQASHGHQTRLASN
ncbi:MAG: DNA-deoxyinosine glycosylase [Methylococcales bacterium]|nr:DNA-deoxyinosine glycosylase [Methylococcales bacterium]